MRELTWPALFGWLDRHPSWSYIRAGGERRMWKIGNLHVIFVVRVGEAVPTQYLATVAKHSGIGQRQLVNEARVLRTVAARQA